MFRRRRRERSPGRVESQAAVTQSEQALAQALARRAKAREISGELRRQRESNQFADMFRRALR